MASYILRRIALSIFVIVGVSMLAFGVLFITGDPAALMISEANITGEEFEEFRRRMGFDRPVYIQYLDFASNALRGDLGSSIHFRRPVVDLIKERFPATIQLTFASLAFAIMLAVPIGVISATKRNSIWDKLVMSGGLIGQSIPQFWLGIMLMLFFSVILGLLPVSGRGTISHLILPAITLGVYPLARNARLIRSCVLEVLNHEYVVTARAKGLKERVVIFKHALRNALIPVVTVLGYDFGILLGGAIIVEQIFAWPGLGRLVLQAIYAKDFPIVQGTVIVMAVVFVLINLVVDLINAWLDPRIRYS